MFHTVSSLSLIAKRFFLGQVFWPVFAGGPAADGAVKDNNLA